MTEQNIIERLMRATQGLAYWSRELLKVNAAIERYIAGGRADVTRRDVITKDNDNAGATP
jgi:hypothetical protein